VRLDKLNQSISGKLKMNHACISSIITSTDEIIECAENYCIMILNSPSEYQCVLIDSMTPGREG
jgi:hypothetical protein